VRKLGFACKSSDLRSLTGARIEFAHPTGFVFAQQAAEAVAAGRCAEGARRRVPAAALATVDAGRALGAAGGLL
jgi:hypothetical protein